MNKSSANLIALGRRELRAIGEKCDPACFTWYACANSKPDGLCDGFILLDGESKRHLHKLLSEDDGKYIQSCMNIVQRECNDETKETLVSEVLRCLPEAEPEPRPTGFTAMRNAAFHVNPSTSESEPETEERATSGFSAMLRASANGKKTDDRLAIERHHPEPSEIIQRHMPTDFEYQLPQICNETCFIKRHCGAYPAQVGNLCVKRSEQYANRTFIDKEAKTQ